MAYQNGNSRPSCPKASSKRHPSAGDVHSSSRAAESKMRPVTPQKQNKTPNKSGLTPIRPTKSPGPGVKLKSGLTPIKPTVSNVPHKSPFQKERTKLKSGLAPIRPSGFEPRPPPSELDGSVLMARRKSGLLPVRPGQTFGTHGIERHRINLDVSHAVGISSHHKPFHLPSKPASSISEPNLQNGSRRKSGLIPIKPPGGLLAGRDPQLGKPRLSVANFPFPRPITQSLSQSRFRPNVQASLNAISEDHESPTSLKSNLSGLALLDDSEDMSVVIKHKKGQGSSRVPLPRASLSSTHFSASDNNTSVCRIPKRVLHFDDDDLTVHTKNVLKDKSSRMNVFQEKVKSPPKENDPNIPNKPETTEDKREALLKRKKEIEDTMSKLNNELEEINLQLKLDDVKITSNNTLDDSENIVTKFSDDDLDSPFANVNSPCAINPIELLPLDKSKRPENIYKIFRQSCSFLKTPQPSAFNKDHRYSRREPSSVTETPMNVSHRVQQQLADLFSDS